MKWHGPERECWRVYMVDISAERIKVNANRLHWLTASYDLSFLYLTYRILDTWLAEEQLGNVSQRES